MRFRQALLLYHVESRERLINEMMLDCLEKSGIADEIIIGECYDVISRIYDYSPDLIVSFLPRDDYSSSLFTMVKMRYQCVWIAIPIEGFMSLDEHVMSILVGRNHQPRELIDYYWFWGPAMADAAGKVLLDFGKVTSSDRINVFGYLYYEREMIQQHAKATRDIQIINEIKQHYVKTILVVTALMLKNILLEELIGQSCIDRSEKELAEGKSLIDANNYYSDHYIDAIYNTAQRCEDYLFVIKLHPVESEHFKRFKGKGRYERLENMRNVYIVTEPVHISFLLSKSDCMVHYGSTTSLEAYIYQVPSIGLVNDHRPVCNKAYGAANMYATEKVIVSKTEDIIDAIKHATFRRELLTEKALLDYMNYHYGEPYCPSQLLRDLFYSVNGAQKISIRSRFVASKIWSRYCIYRRARFVAEAFRYLLHGNIFEARKRMMWISMFWLSCLRSLPHRTSWASK